jgi:hypothetical protein
MVFFFLKDILQSVLDQHPLQLIYSNVLKSVASGTWFTVEMCIRYSCRSETISVMTVDQLGLSQPGTDSYDENKGRMNSRNVCEKHRQKAGVGTKKPET